MPLVHPTDFAEQGCNVQLAAYEHSCAEPLALQALDDLAAHFQEYFHKQLIRIYGVITPTK